MLQQLDGKYIYTFLKVYAQRNVSKAAIILGFSQSTVTHHIQILEETLQVQLFHRTINGVAPTAKGHIFAQYAHKFFQLADELDEEMQELRGTVRIKAPESFCVTHLTKPIIYFLECHDSIEIKLTTGFYQSIIDDVINHKIDFGIVPIDPRHNQLVYTPILEEEFVFILSSRIAEDRLFNNDVSVIGFGNNCIYQSMANRILADHGKFHYKNIEYASLEMIKQTVCYGAGIALVPRCSIQDELRANQLKVLQLGEPVMINHGIIEWKSRQKNEISDLFKHFIINHFHT